MRAWVTAIGLQFASGDLMLDIMWDSDEFMHALAKFKADVPLEAREWRESEKIWRIKLTPGLEAAYLDTLQSVFENFRRSLAGRFEAYRMQGDLFMGEPVINEKWKAVELWTRQ